MKFFSLLISSFAIIQMTTAGDEDILSNFIVPQNVTTVNGNFFTFTGLQSIVGSNPPPTFKVSKTSLVEFPALNMDRVFPMMLFNSRLGLLLHLTSILALPSFFSWLMVPFKWDLWIQPTSSPVKHYKRVIYSWLLRGLCTSSTMLIWTNLAIAIAAFGSANAGTVSIPHTFCWPPALTTRSWLHPSDRRSPFKLSRLVLLPSLEDGTLYHQSNDFKTFPYSLVFNAFSFSNYYYFFWAIE